MSDAMWWKVSKYSDVKREPVRVVRETEQSVWVVGYGERHDRVAKRSEYRSYFPTEAEAVAFLLERAQKKADAAARNLHEARTAVGELTAWLRKEGTLS